jgi:hypothetical protein
LKCGVKTDLFQANCLCPLLNIAIDRVCVHNRHVVSIIDLRSASRLHHGLKTGRRVESHNQVALRQLHALLNNWRTHQKVALTEAKSMVLLQLQNIGIYLEFYLFKTSSCFRCSFSKSLTCSPSSARDAVYCGTMAAKSGRTFLAVFSKW